MSLRIDQYPDDHIHCNTHGQALVNGVAIADMDHCIYCEALVMDGAHCDCAEANVRSGVWVGPVLLTAIVMLSSCVVWTLS